MKPYPLALLCLILPVPVLAADLDVIVDGRAVPGVDSVIYDPAALRLDLQLSGGLVCRGAVIVPGSAQLGLGVADDVHALSGPVSFLADGQAAVLSISSQLGTLSCAPDRGFFDRFESPG
jgi:hypothetical protein